MTVLGQKNRAQGGFVLRKEELAWTPRHQVCQDETLHMGNETDSPIRNVEQAIERLYDLNVGIIGTGRERHERPHKPLLLLVILDLVAGGNVSPEHIPWSRELRDRFTKYFEQVRQLNDDNTPDNPFFYLRGDGFWQPLLVSNSTEVHLERTPTVTDATAGRVFGRLVNGFENYVRDTLQRLLLREAIVSRYFPKKRGQLEPLFCERTSVSEGNNAETDQPNKEGESGGRSPAFRRKVLDVYDSQCAACGLRIKLPEKDLTFVDGAHLIPFFVSRNDHPTNGIALCKNHHWAMDRFLIVPTPECLWEVSPVLDSRRSMGEKDLCDLDNRPLLPPHDDAFLPAKEALAWRADRLYRG